MNERKVLTGRVAAIINAHELVVNIGSENGVTQGMKFAVLSEAPLEIRDPESDAFLGLIDREKVRVEATKVDARFTICKTYRIIQAGKANLSGMISAWSNQPEIKESLHIDDSSIPPPLSEEESYVKVKDRVVQVDVNAGSVPPPF